MKPYVLIPERITNNLIENYSNKNKEDSNKLIREFKSDKDLMSLYMIVENLKTAKVDVEDIDSYIRDNIELAKELNVKKFDKIAESLAKETDIKDDKLLSSINTILFETKRIDNLTDYTNSYRFVKNHLYNNTTWESETKQTLQKLSEDYLDLDEEDQILFEKYMKSEDKENFIKNEINENIDFLDTLIEQVEDFEEKYALSQAKIQILESDFTGEDKINKLLEIHNLKKDLLK